MALLSAATLAYEVLLVRVFAIEQFHHFAYMAVGVAMLGFGAAGTLVAIAGRIPARTASRWFPMSATAAAFALIASPALTHTISVDSTQIAWAADQWIPLGFTYVLLALPFGLAALAILLGLGLEVDRPGLIYGASFLGSGTGAVVATAASAWLLPERALAVPAAIAALAALAAPKLKGLASTGLRWGVAAAAVGVLVHPLWRLEVTPYKGLPQVEAFPGSRRIAEHPSPLGWVVAVQAPAFRDAPGLSLGYGGDIPSQTAIFVDGQLVGARTDWSSPDADRGVLDWLPSALPYALGRRERVLVLGAGGGTEVWNAALHGARSVVAVELHPDVARLASTPERILEANVEWVIGDARAVVARGEVPFDLVTLGLGGRGLGTTAAGLHALNEDFLHTVDAYVAYLARLGPEGVLAITRWLSVPPRGSVRVILTAAEALRRTAPESIASGLVVMRSWATATVLVKPSGFTADEAEALGAWAELRSFDVDWRPGLDAPASTFHLIDRPALFEAAAVAASPTAAKEWAEAYPFDVEPVDDARPYPGQHLRAGSLGALLRTPRSDWLPFAEWGYIALLATLLQSVALAILAILLPAALGAGSVARRRLAPILAYFSAVGLAYLAVEIAAIQQLSLLLGHPVYAVTAVLVAFLVSSGLGSIWSDRIGTARGRGLLLGLSVLGLAYSGVLLSLVHFMQPLPLAARAAFGGLAVAPLAFLMGVPFPVGLRVLAQGDGPCTAWAWAANGFASVVAAPGAALVAVEAGSPAVLLGGGIAYAMAAAVLHRAGGGQTATSECP